ncbi:penicillin-binding protein 1B [Ursidibacter maritimus]|uniref:Penicillin-binding protein 1B n=1 Tax=Ursidibacter maritimus TaxID=1331689 RepID=A0A949T0Q3_9PAST|nr:penicillin-binding protein 1B [Ursidibacter maritimus]KAE9542007.1 penicillin-binding protein 1B [Ursidibacter maritimus]MBV6523191.1 penicillin-binding protein 1B [Ursidibacter maritimus]MBV6525367.1 penicillin-binding protein 1B [Ursidibacter maritimus]MBV6527457.1 penicillin-binding protein 1B [Ursidibacter maritimus]MBV6529246.1 penicillin-binding protein 1B [Ursidibacter maritimus]
MSNLPETEQPEKPKRKAYFIPTLFKLSVLGACCVGIYGIYLDSKIRSKMEGQIWQLPAEVYSRIESIKLSDNLDLEQTKLILIHNGYREVSNIVTPGDFKIDGNTLVLLRRAFPFPETPEAQRVLRMRFIDNKLAAIEDLIQRKQVDEFRLDPKLIAMLHSDNDEERQALHLHNYPSLLIDTLILTEDKRFYEHNGISPLSIIRALVTNYQAGKTVQGASTLTQQLVKNLFLTSEKSLERKINEALMSIILDARYDKNRILETYLNEIYLGQNGSYQIHGFALASQFYFGRPIQEISLSQMALLVGMAKGASLYNPWRNPQLALERRNVVLKILLEHQKITQSEYDFLVQQPLGIKEKGSVYRQQPAFMQTLATELKAEFGENNMTKLSGARIFTTLDHKQQSAAEQAVINGLESLEEQNKKIKDLESAIVVAEYKTGKVRAVVGGRLTQFAGFNRAIQTKRQIGSLVKPSIYAIGLAQPNLFRLNTPINNQPITITIKGSPPWSPRNYDRRFSGSVMLMDALVRSLNIPTVNIGMKVGLKKVIAKQKEMGWDSAEIPPYPATLLGSYSISPYDVTKSYQVLANSGLKTPLTTIEAIISHTGEVIQQRDIDKVSTQVLPPEAAIQALYAMQQVVERGTARSLQNDFAQLRLAGKTGTTNNARDTWFVGIDGENVTTIWLGKDNNSDTHLTGSSGALQVYKEYLKRTTPLPFVLPKTPNLQWVGINSYGSWDCSSPRQIPVWKDKGQRYCTSGGTVVEAKPSVWDALSLSKDKQQNQPTKADEVEGQAPIEEVAPTE